jgi:U3 small nucleolar ribonucleoprotein protein IMP3
MVRALKHHEHKLLRKVDFFKSDSKQGSIRQNDVVRRVRFSLSPRSTSHPRQPLTQVAKQYMIQKPEDYTSYNRLCGQLRQLAHRLTLLAPENPYRLATEKKLLDKLYDMAILSERSKLSAVENKVTVSAFARRRLNVILTRLQMAPDLKAATTFIEGGQVRVGTEVVTDPAFLVTRNMEDFVTWVDSSKIKRTIHRYRDKLDDFDLL